MRCSECDKYFKNMLSLTRHIKIHKLNSKDYYGKYLKEKYMDI